MNGSALNEMTLSELADGIAKRMFSSREVVSACLDRIAARDPTLKAWV